MVRKEGPAFLRSLSDLGVVYACAYVVKAFSKFSFSE